MKKKKLDGSMNMKSSLMAKLRDKDGKELLETKIKGGVEKRFSRKGGKAIQIVWKDNKIVHLHCKDKNCGNEWKLKDGADWTGKFNIISSTIKCLQCGREYEPG